MANKKRNILILFLLMVISIAQGQTGADTCHIVNSRLRLIDFYNVNVGVEAAAKVNYIVSPKVSFGVGSIRNILNANAGVKLKLCNPLAINKNEFVSYITLPLFLSTDINIIKWKFNSVFVGGELEYNIPLGARWRFPEENGVKRDKNLVQSHATAVGKFGFKLSRWILYAFYEYDMKPAFNQKYVYESMDYDYFTLKNSLFERWRIGFSINYMFQF